MLIYPEINPIAIQVGPLSVHWYGLMYLLGLMIGWGLLLLRVRQPGAKFTTEQISDILFYSTLGIVLGGRIGYMLLYAWSDMLAHPVQLFQIWKGGMSFHGGLIGVIIALNIYAKRINQPLGNITDFIAPVVPIGLGLGRIGNFINGELWGRTTDVAWGMIFPSGGQLPRHPSQLYEAMLEGIVLFAIMWIYSGKPRPRWAVSALFLALYGLFRFIVEFYREPDPQIGFIAFGWLTKGQLLSLPMLLIGVGMLVWAYRRDKLCSNI